MSWASQRQFSVVFFSILIFGTLAVLSYLLFFRTEPTCFDGTKNGEERGVDCGGSCLLICSADAAEPAVLWARALPVTEEVYNAIAVIKNTNNEAGTRRIRYLFSLYDDENLLIAERRGETFLLPAETLSLFEASIIVGNRIPVRTFLSFEPGATFERMETVPARPGILNIDFNSDPLARLSALVKSGEFGDVGPVAVVAILYDEEGTAFAASQTIIDVLPGRGQKEVVFTWPGVIPAPSRIEVTPRILQSEL